MTARSLRVTVLLALASMLGGVALCATVSPKVGGMLLLAGWLTAIGSLHALGRSALG